MTDANVREQEIPDSNEPHAKRQKKLNENGTHSNSSNSSSVAFEDVFHRLHRQVLSDLDILPEINDSLKAEMRAYYDECLKYTVMGGKMTRGLTVVKGCQLLLSEDGKTLTEEQMLHASVLGWCVEWLQAFFLVADDVMDGSITRRGAPCWYRLPHVTQANAVNDALMLEAVIYNILRQYFSDKPYYGRLLELMHTCTYKTVVGQHLDTNATQFGTGLDLSRFTQDRWRAIVTFKTAFYSFYLSCALAMTLSGETDPAIFSLVEQVCLPLGQYFQAQDDYLDCYGDPETIGKIGTDIRDGKCSWLVCEALVRGSDAQREVIAANYNKFDDEAEKRVKAVFKDLNLEAVYADYEEDMKVKIVERKRKKK